MTGTAITQRTNAAADLQRLAEAAARLETIATVAEAKHVRTMAELFRQAAKESRQGLAQQNRCARVRVLAERRMGQLLAKMPRVPPTERHRGRRIPVEDRQVFTSELKAAGISHDLAYSAQRLAQVSEEMLIALFDECDRTGEEINGVRVRAMVDAYMRDEDPVIETASELVAADVLRPLGLLLSDLDGLSPLQTRHLLAEVFLAYRQLCPETEPQPTTPVTCDWRFLKGRVLETIGLLLAGKIGYAAIRSWIRIDEILMHAMAKGRRGLLTEPPHPVHFSALSPGDQFARGVEQSLLDQLLKKEDR